MQTTMRRREASAPLPRGRAKTVVELLGLAIAMGLVVFIAIVPRSTPLVVDSSPLLPAQAVERVGPQPPLPPGVSATEPAPSARPILPPEAAVAPSPVSAPALEAMPRPAISDVAAPPAVEPAPAAPVATFKTPLVVQLPSDTPAAGADVSSASQARLSDARWLNLLELSCVRRARGAHGCGR